MTVRDVTPAFFELVNGSGEIPNGMLAMPGERHKMHGLGYIPEPLESTADFEPVLCSGSAPPSCDNRECCGEITDQGATGSCVAHAVANAIQFLRRSHWHEDAPKPCILSIYALARVHSGKSLADDSGSSLRAALRAVTEHGWCPDEVWPWSVDAIHEHEPWSVAQAGYVALCFARTLRAVRDEDRGESRETHPCPELGSSAWGSDWGERGFARIAWGHILGDKTHMVAVVDEA